MIRLRSIMDLSYQDYRKASMVLGMCFCDFKCWKDLGVNESNPCQNQTLLQSPIIEISIDEVIQRYINNPLSHAIVFSGMEPLLQQEEIKDFISDFRKISEDDIVIFTGYYLIEISNDLLSFFSSYSNIYLKCGRYIPNRNSIYDYTLGVSLASDNQHGYKIS